MAKKRINTRKLTYGGLLAAIITLLMSELRIVVPPFGYFHLADGVVLVTGMLLGPYGSLAAAIGAGLGDTLGGFANYALFRALIKGVMALITGQFAQLDRGLCARNQAVLAAACLWLILGYFVADTVVYGSVDVAIWLIPGNVTQAGVAYAVALLLIGARRIFPKRLR